MKPMYVDLQGKVALVTGGGTGIGRAISIGLARCGAGTIVNYSRSKDASEETVAQIEKNGGKALAIKADVTDEKQVKMLIDKTCEHFGRLDILVANAGGVDDSHLTPELTSEDWDHGFNLNCKSVFYCVKHAAPKLSDNTGRIIITSSDSGLSGCTPGQLTYAAAKGAIYNMVRNWTKEFAPRGITVNAIAPGIIWTRIYESMDQDEYKKLFERIPLGRDGQPEDCVGAVLMFASNEGNYITGQTIEINGGMLMP